MIYLLKQNIETHVKTVGAYTRAQLHQWQQQYPDLIADVRGRGLLVALEFNDQEIASKVYKQSLSEELVVNFKHGRIFRIFPALTITREEIEEGLNIFH